MEILQAVTDKVIVEEIKPKSQTTASGLIVPSDNVPQGYGKVLTIGSDIIESLKNELKIGDVVIFGKFAGQAIIVENKILKVLMDKEIYGIVKAE